MDQNTSYARPFADVAREHLTTLFDAYRAHTGLAATYVGALARGGDPKFFRGYYLTNNFGLETYDAVIARFSAIWPQDLAWPEEVPRQAPGPVAPDELQELATRLTRLGIASSALPASALHKLSEIING